MLELSVKYGELKKEVRELSKEGNIIILSEENEFVVPKEKVK